MAAKARQPTVPLGRFLSAIGDGIATMPAEELRDVVLAFAESVDASQRPVFLQRFGAVPARPIEPVDALLADVELLEEEAEATGEPEWDDYDEYHDRYGWSPDDECREPDWASELVALLRRTGVVFLNGDPSAAVQVYERIFTVVEGAIGNGWSVASETGDADVMKEAAARYLRTVGESGERGDRPARLRGAASLLGRALLGHGVSYAAVEGSRAAPPAKRELLLEDWVAALAPLVEQDDAYWGDWAHRLLLEIVKELRGLPGLAELARRGGRRTGRNFLAWFDAARRDGNDAVAAVAGQEGLRSLKPGAERAALAERLAAMAEGAGRSEDAIAARLEAWDAEPSLDRLLRVAAAARRVGTEDATLAALAKRRPGSEVVAPLRIMLLVVGGRLDAALKEFRDRSARPGDPLAGAANASVAAEVLIPILLTAGVDATHHKGFAGSVLAEQLKTTEALVGRTQHPSFSRYRFGEDDDQNGETRPALADVTLAALLVEALNRLTIPAGKRRSYLDTGATLAADAVKHIVENKNRRRYSQAAALAVGHAEAVAIAHGQAAGDAAAESAQSRYPRHVAYRSELISARASSPLLTPAARLR
jgi:hypothetical protein